MEIIFISLGLVSLSGISVILLKKIPALVQLPDSASPEGSAGSLLKNGLKKIPGSQRFDYELYLQKMLSRVRVLTLKTENKTGNWLERLRQRRNGNSNDGYWEELKKAKNGK